MRLVAIKLLLPLALTTFIVASSCGSSWGVSGWVAVRSPSTVGSDFLTSVSCASRSSCFAVGYSEPSHGASRTLIEHWNGHIWSITRSPNLGANANELDGVDCASLMRCWAVGTTGAGTLILRWNGHAWNVAVGEIGGSTGDYLASVSCGAPTMCVAVGKSKGLALIQEWTGEGWISMRSVKSASVPFLASVSCASRVFCLAGGQTLSGRPFAEVWRGRGWVNVSPDVVGTVTDVSCLSAVFCMSVGTLGASGAMAAQFKAGKWVVRAVPQTVTDGLGLLSGVSCSQGNDCTAVGYTLSQAPGFFTTVAHWDGSRWTRVASAAPGPSELTSVWTGASSTTPVAVGSRGAASERTLIEEPT